MQFFPLGLSWALQILSVGMFVLSQHFSQLLKSLILVNWAYSESCFREQALCGNNWKQLCIIWCTELLPLCENPGDRNLWQCAWIIWCNCRHNNVSSSNMASIGHMRALLVGNKTQSLSFFFLSLSFWAIWTQCSFLNLWSWVIICTS